MDTQQVQTPDFMQQLLNGQIGSGSGGGGGGASGAVGLMVNAPLKVVAGVELVDTPGLIPDTANGHLSMEQIALGSLDTKKGFLGLDLSDLFSRLTSEITDHTEGVGGGGGEGGDYGGGGGDYSGGGGGGDSDSGIAAPSDGGGGGGDDFQARVHSGNFDFSEIRGEAITDGGFIGAPGPTPDIGGGSSVGHSMD